MEKINKRIINDELEKLRLSFSRCANHDVVPLTIDCYKRRSTTKK